MIETIMGVSALVFSGIAGVVWGHSSITSKKLKKTKAALNKARVTYKNNLIDQREGYTYSITSLTNELSAAKVLARAYKRDLAALKDNVRLKVENMEEILKKYVVPVNMHKDVDIVIQVYLDAMEVTHYRIPEDKKPSSQLQDSSR